MSSDEKGSARHISTAEYMAWLERARPLLAEELTAALPQEARDAGLRFEWVPERPHCLPGCDRIDGHDGRDPGACMGPGGILWPAGATPAWCYRLTSGAMVHVKPDCRC
jgi:hypothetical protein